MFEGSGIGGRHARQLEIHLTSRQNDPERAAADMAAQLRSTPLSEWDREFHHG